MLVINKRVGTVSVRINAESNVNGSRVSGEVYPFGKHFHSVRFSAIREYDFGAQRVTPAEPEIGFGGNQFKGEKAARMLKAAEVAYEQACYYADLINDFSRGEFIETVNCMIAQDDSEGLIDCLYLTPMESEEKDQRGLDRALTKLLADATLLGHAGEIRATNFDKSLPEAAFYGLMKLCSRHKDYALNEEDSFEERQEAVKRVINSIWYSGEAK